MKNIIMVVEGKYPQDIRVRKESESLVKLGFDVTVVSIVDTFDKEEEVIKGVKIIRIGGHTPFIKGIMDVVNVLFHFNPFIYFKLNKLIQSFENSILIIHDLPLVLTISKIKLNNQKLILDMHENFPEATKTWFLWRKSKLIRLKNKLFFNYKKWLKFEKKALKLIDGLITVVDEMKANVLSKSNFDKPILILPNLEQKSFFDVLDFNDSSSEFVPENSFSITYMGGIGPHRGLDTPIIAMPDILKKIPTAKLLIFGSAHKDNINYLKKLAEKFSVSGSVIFHGFIPFKEFNKVMLSSDVNIIPHKSDDHTDNTIPHKLFQMMMVKKPILVSSCKPLKRYVELSKSGYVFDADSPESFANNIVKINENYSEALLKAQNGFESAYNNELNWEFQEEKFSQFLKQF